MKQISHSLWRWLVLFVAISSPFYAKAWQDAYVGKLKYSIDRSTKIARVIKDDSYETLTGSLVIPGTILIDGPYTVVSIENGAFWGCDGLTGSLTIQKGVKTIGDRAFGCCGFTGSLTISESVTEIGASAFQQCSHFTGSLTIPEGVTKIGKDAFWVCTGFTGSLTIPESVTSIGDGAFSGCSGLTGSLTIPESVTSIGDGAFSGCSGLTGSLTIPESVTSIGDRAFSGCSGITGSITIPESVTSIGYGAFGGMQIEELKIDSGNEYFSVEDGVLFNKNKSQLKCFPAGKIADSYIMPQSVDSIEAYAFYNCKNLTGTLTIPKSITKIEGFTFYGCSGLTGTLIIPESVTSIGGAAFQNCSGFTGSLTIPKNVTSIGGSAFYGCSGFTGTLIIPERVTSIGSTAFANCRGFTGSLTIPESVTQIGTQILAYCLSIKYFRLKSRVPARLIHDSFGFARNLFYVPTGSGETYRNAQGWNSYSSIYEIGDANRNKILTVADAVAVTNDIVGASNEKFDLVCADITEDDKITISDATGIVEAVLTYNRSGISSEKMRRRVPLREQGLIVADNFRLEDNAATVGLHINGVEDAVAMQIDIRGLDGLAIKDIELSPALSETHTLMTAPLDNGGIRAAVFSISNAPISLDGEPLLTINVEGAEGDLTADNCIVAAADASEAMIGFVGGKNLGESGIGLVPGVQSTVYTAGGQVIIANAKGCRAAIYDIAGRLVADVTVASNLESFDFSHGIYIVKIGNQTQKVVL